jgi:hypothetical protein
MDTGCDHHSRHFWVEPTNAVARDDKISRIENVPFDEIKQPHDQALVVPCFNPA